ncbi:MAG: hypothetical protein GY903_25180 [Fuerstiella sp.]|nr:hypothetical protein [Fuerstiella sp.]MCP4857790.1 hypothetical protein [Fuerstiella sp.]
MHRSKRLSGLVVWSCLTSVCVGGDPARLDARALLGKTPILFTVHVPDRDATHRYMFPGTYPKMGSQLKVLDPASGRTRVLLSAPTGIIRRPCVHFDGRRIVFAMCKTAKESFHIYEIEVEPATLFSDDRELEPRQLTVAPDVYDVDPIYLPDGKIAFCSTRDIKYVPCATQRVPQVFRMDSDGANIHQITRSTAHENEISLMPDGRILYSRWDYVDRNFGDGHGFWVTNPDGGNQSIIWGNNTTNPSAGWTSRMMPGGRVLCILGTHHGSLGGAMALLDPRRAIDGRQSIVRTWPEDVIKRFDDPTPTGKLDRTRKMSQIWPAAARELIDEDHNYWLYGWTDAQKTVQSWYNTPFPLDDNHFLYVLANNRASAAAIYLGDVDGNEVKLYEEEPGCYDPMPLAPHAAPPNIGSGRDFANNDGCFDIQNVYEGTHMRGVETGSVEYVRVVEALSKRGRSGGDWKGLGRQSPTVNWTDFNAKRILGTAPVESDGSASFYVPSDRFVYFQLLDKDGMMIQSMRTGTSIHSGERQGCVGCHETRSNAGTLSSSNRLGKAFQREPSELEPWYGEARAFSYMAEIQPVLDKHCVSCHDFGTDGGQKVILAGDKGFAFNASYSELQHKGYTGAIGAGPAGHLPAKTWGSLTSPLIKLLADGHYDVKLDKESMDRLCTWIDLNSPYYPTTYSSRLGPGPGRNPLTSEQTSRFFTLTGLNQNNVGEAQYFNGPVVSFDRPEKSPCLEPLKKDQAAYEEVLAIIRSGKNSLEEQPRADMPGRELLLHAIDRRRQAHRKKYSDIEQKVRAAIRNGTKVMDSESAEDGTRGL